MTTILNASTSAGLIITPDTSGNIQLQYNGVAAPAFSARAATTQSLSNTTYTKVTLGTEEFDTNSNFASSRFTPTVAGYYLITGSVIVQSGASAVIAIHSAWKGARKVVALDINPNAVRATNQNARKYGLASVIDARVSDVFSVLNFNEEIINTISALPKNDNFKLTVQAKEILKTSDNTNI
jgi:hypothetical protein